MRRMRDDIMGVGVNSRRWVSIGLTRQMSSGHGWTSGKGTSKSWGGD